MTTFLQQIYDGGRRAAATALAPSCAAFVLAAAWVLLGPQAAVAQPADSAARPVVDWRLVAEGRTVDVPLAAGLPVDSLPAVADRALRALQADGYYFARLDSVVVDSNAVPVDVAFFATRGPDVRIGRIRFEGMVAMDSTALSRLVDSRAGQVLDPQRLEADFEALLARYERAGYPLAQVRLDAVDLIPGDPPRLDLRIVVDEGATLALHRVELAGAIRTKAAFAARLAGLRPGQPLANYAPDEIRRRLEETPFFREVGMPELRLVPDSGAVLRIPVTEEAPGAFDLVLGYLPAAGAGEKGSVIGNGHLELRNLFGRGRELSLRLNRLPRQASSAEVRVADPFVFGRPVGVEARFDGLQQDSTYAKQAYGGEVSYRLGTGFRAFATFSREVTRPGQYGLRLVPGTARQRVAGAEGWFAGLGVRYQRLDRGVNPSRGLVLTTNLEGGRKARTDTRVAAGDTTLERAVLRQQRLRAEARAYVPTLRRQVFVAGLDASVLLSDVYDRSDLFRFGGARTLRGYNEEAFLGRIVGRVLAEYRFQLDRTSYSYLFVDLGYVDRPAIGDELEALRGLHPGYGLGIQFQTNLGLVNVSAGFNPDDGPTAARIHAGLSFGL